VGPQHILLSEPGCWFAHLHQHPALWCHGPVVFGMNSTFSVH
jgi:hypothetical protein